MTTVEKWYILKDITWLPFKQSLSNTTLSKSPSCTEQHCTIFPSMFTYTSVSQLFIASYWSFFPIGSERDKQWNTALVKTYQESAHIIKTQPSKQMR